MEEVVEIGSINYVREVAAQFLSCCSNVTILGPTDFTMIAEWEKQEIPLAIVLKSIDEICRESSEETPQMDSINAIQDKVKRDFVSWLQSRGDQAN